MATAFSRFSRQFCSAIQETLKIGETIGREGGRCAGKRKKERGTLRYALIGTQEPGKIGGRSVKRREPLRERRREPAKIGGTTAATLAYPRVTLQGV